jgi:hypothetical protein
VEVDRQPGVGERRPHRIPVGLAEVGEVGVLGVGVGVHPDEPELLDALDLDEALVDVPPRQDRLREQPVARLGLHLGHRVVVDLDGEVAQRQITPAAQLLPAEADRVRVDEVGPDALGVHHLESRGDLRGAGGDLVHGRAEHVRHVVALLHVGADDRRRARAADGVAVEDPLLLAVDLLDLRDAVLVALRCPFQPEVPRLAEVGVDVDDEQVAGRCGVRGHAASPP